MLQRNRPADCLRPPHKEGLPTQCQQLIRGYGECKKGQIDMRKRFRGNKPIAASQELEAGGEEKDITMLYAGRGTYAGTGPKPTSGRDDQDEELERYVRNDGIEDIRKK